MVCLVFAGCLCYPTCLLFVSGYLILWVLLLVVLILWVLILPGVPIDFLCCLVVCLLWFVLVCLLMVFTILGCCVFRLFGCLLLVCCGFM